MEVGGELHAQFLYQWGKSSLYLLNRTLYGMGPTADLHILDKKSLGPTKSWLHFNSNILYVSPKL